MTDNDTLRAAIYHLTCVGVHTVGEEQFEALMQLVEADRVAVRIDELEALLTLDRNKPTFNPGGWSAINERLAELRSNLKPDRNAKEGR